ncbi:hypothetical protein B9Z55_014987 [Caenorhabditis nigoni]|uniref:Uncharacterized protein n=1 Tax=Caenorhabditis nigoni TaxID=1611254 RepID=A0A2G5U892_9PELO|nr:hypothetical protein B9Z55_014987 [Caenorhabditis nigoni]
MATKDSRIRWTRREIFRFTERNKSFNYYPSPQLSTLIHPNNTRSTTSVLRQVRVMSDYVSPHQKSISGNNSNLYVNLSDNRVVSSSQLTQS